MTSAKTNNLAVISKRWPHLVTSLSAKGNYAVDETLPLATPVIQGLHLCSGYDRQREGHWQAQWVPEGTGIAWVYGIGSGECIRSLLHRDGLERLAVVIVSKSCTQASLSSFDHGDWLSDPRVELTLADSRFEFQAPFAAIPACVRLADREVERLRDLIQLELNTPYINARFAANPQFQAQIEANLELVAQDADVAELFDTLPGVRVVVCGAGPSLAEHFDYLKKAQRPIVAVDGAVIPLINKGIIPDFVVSMDGHQAVTRFFSNNDSRLAKSSLIYFPVVQHQIPKQWPGKRYVAYSQGLLYAAARERHPKASLFAAGSVAHPAVDLAVHMGATQVELAGLDFSYPRDQSHVAGFALQSSVPSSARQHHSLVDGFGNRVASQANLIGYLRDLEIYVAQHPQVRFVNLSRSGARIQGTTYPEGIATDG